MGPLWLDGGEELRVELKRGSWMQMNSSGSLSTVVGRDKGDGFSSISRFWIHEYVLRLMVIFEETGRLNILTP